MSAMADGSIQRQNRDRLCRGSGDFGDCRAEAGSGKGDWHDIDRKLLVAKCDNAERNGV